MYPFDAPRFPSMVLIASLLAVFGAGCGGKGGGGDGTDDDCPTGQRACGETCVNLETNAANCGACGVACSATETCAAGTCSCGDAFTSCSGSCVETATDPDHCGDCATACSAELVCSQGSCASDCAAGETNCARACVDVATNVLNCGECGSACTSGQACVEGTCSCGDGGLFCGGACVSVASDPSNCGGCAVRCGANELCDGGRCVAAPPNPPVMTASCTETFAEAEDCAATASGATYYVATGGDDANDGRSEDAPIQTLERAGELAVGAGDRVLFRCGDVWHGQQLVISRSGAECAHVVYGSYPAACAEQPRFSGSLPITGWTRGSDGVWAADLTAGENAGRFPNGINQLFRGEQRLRLGRWPNIDDPDSFGGYSRIETHEGGTVVGDSRLPSADWSGAVFRYFGIRWLLLHREVASAGDGTLSLASAIECYDGCGDPNPSDAADFGWGYYLTHHRATLDQQDEWYYDDATKQVYLVSGAEPTGIEGSRVAEDVVDPKSPSNDEGYSALVQLGENLGDPIHHVVVENLRLENGWRHAIASPVNQIGGENDHLTIRCNTLRNPDSTGLRFTTWTIEDPTTPDGWNGGQFHAVLSNVIDGANHFGILSVARDTTIQDNLVANTGLVENLGASGLGCRFEDDDCTENGDAMDLQKWDDALTGSSNLTVRRNRIERAGYCGIDAFGTNMLLEENVIIDACYSKGDCGAVRTMDTTDITLRRNVIRNVISPLDGFSSTYYERFGFGLYIDQNTTATATGNTIERTQGYGIIYQGSATSGDVQGNTVYDVEGRTVVFAGFNGVISSLVGNVLVGTRPMRLLFSEGDGDVLTSNENYFIQPYSDGYISIQSTGDWTDRELADWQSVSGQDADSVEAWFSLAEGAAPTTELFVNDTAIEQTVTLTGAYVDLDQQAIVGSVVLAPFTSRVLVAQ